MGLLILNDENFKKREITSYILKEYETTYNINLLAACCIRQC